MMTNTALGSLNHDWKRREEAKVKREIKMCANEFASLSSPKKGKRNCPKTIKATSMKKSANCKKNGSSTSKQSSPVEQTTPGQPQNTPATPRVRAGEKIRFVRDNNVKASHLSKFNADSDDETSSSIESPILLICNKTGQKGNSVGTPQCEVSNNETQLRSSVQFNGEDPSSKCSAKIEFTPNRKMSHPDEEDIDDFDVTVFEDSEEDSSGWGTDSDDDSSFELEKEAHFPLLCHQTDDSSPSILTESTDSFKSRGGLHDSSGKSFTSSSPSPLSLGPKAFVKVCNKELKDATQRKAELIIEETKEGILVSNSNAPPK
jgi:hypothetical protein